MNGRLPKLITRNFRLKLIAVVVACGMWVGVVYASDPPAIVTYNVHVQPGGVLRPGLVLLDAISPVDVKIAGVASNVKSAEVTSHLSAVADLSHISKPGVYYVNLKVDQTDDSVWIWSAPKKVEVKIDHVSTRSIPVHLTVTAAPPVGSVLNLGQTTITPADVSVRGPESVLANLQAEAIVNLSTYRTSLPIPKTVKLINTDGHSAELTVTPSAVSVGVVITSENTERVLPVTPTFSGNGEPASGYMITGIVVTPATVIATGPSSVLTALTSVNTQPIDLAHVTSSETVSEQLVTASGTTLSTTFVSVVITIAPVPAPTPTPTPTPAP
jgi:YbbR domain-containing protein